jgi:short-subunit dehydrogenase
MSHGLAGYRRGMGDRFAVITGASSGIGLELAHQFTRHRFDVLICADDGQIYDAARAIAEPGTEVIPVQVDLRTPEGVEGLYRRIKDTSRQVDALAVNAGVGQGGAFVESELDDALSIVRLNVESSVHLTWLVLREMVGRNQGRILMTSSIASMMPGSYQAVYNASKSFLQSFAEALQTELSDSDVTVTSLMPGPTDTRFFARADMAHNTRVGRNPKDDPARVAAQGFAALMAGKRRVVGGGVATHAQYVASTFLPDRAKAAMHSLMAKPLKG